MKKILGITLGIMTALGGFVDLGQIVFSLQAGALFGYRLLWVVALGTIAIMVYMELAGRVAVVTRKPIFAVIRRKLGKRVGTGVLIASNLLNLVTCAAELAGISIVLHLLTGAPEKLMLVVATLLLGTIVFLLRFQWIERTFGLTGLAMIVFAVSAVTLGPDWSAAAKGLVPSVPKAGAHDSLLYAYFVVAIFGAMLMVYELHFYSSGAIEEEWTTDDLGENTSVSTLGSVFGAMLTAALLVLGVIVFRPRGITPELLSGAPAAGSFPFGPRALVLTFCGILACVAGAAVETALSSAYNLCQSFGFAWGKNKPARRVPVFTKTWIGVLVLGGALAASGIDPMTLLNVSVVFGMVLMPFTFWPVLAVADDRRVMGQHANGPVRKVLGWAILILISIAALAAVPLMILTKSGTP
jgi:manganese transport protein